MLRRKNRAPLYIILAIILGIFILLMYKFVLTNNIQLKKEPGGSINILLLGRGGGTHDGPDLTDTLIFAMMNPSKNTANLISIPRDLWIPDIKGKINLAYALGQEQNKQGILLTKAVVQKVTGQNIDYTVVIDFSGFVKLIDYLGGVDVSVVSTLNDYNYPIEGKEDDKCGHTDEDIKAFTATASADMDLWAYFPCRYRYLHVSAGTVHMDGETALEFSRSRHGVGAEGSDFARSRRQQEVISAVKDKVLSLGIILNPIKVIGIFNILKDNVDTNVQVNEFDDFINLARKMQGAQIKSYVIDFGDQEQARPGLLIEPIPTKAKEFQYNLIPRVGDGNFSEIQDYISCISESFSCIVTKTGIIKASPTPSPPR